MAKIEIVPGIKCKKCGNLYIPPFSHILCQTCGEQLVEGYNKNDGFIISNKAEIIKIKIAHKFFKDIYEEV